MREKEKNNNIEENDKSMNGMKHTSGESELENLF